MAPEVIFKKPDSLREKIFPYCPGCGHGVIQRLMCEVIDELGIRENTIAIAPVGCAVCGYDYWDVDVSEAAHGRAPAVATGIKRVHPDKTVIVYQGDGDLASIGMAETIHAANRGENFTVIFVNNTNYGMTGGQMAPTTLLNQVTTTSPCGRSAHGDGFPIRMAELIATLPACQFSARTTVADVNGILKTKKYIKKGIKLQNEGGGYSFIEILSNCGTNWAMPAVKANEYIVENIVKVFPLGIYKDTTQEKGEA
ncbi:MAG: 2-oxoglutarate oxidoreductase [Spirochaetales bacterium]|nr:2-oxoglutarate oxidoreductase [Spirochaetales bacterium]